MLRRLLINSVEKLNLGNFSAHSLDKTKPILPQLFKIIEPYGDYKKVEEKLLFVKADEIMMESIVNRENNFNDIDLMKKKDNEIYSTINYDKLNYIFTN